MLSYEHISPDHLELIKRFQFNNNQDVRNVQEFLKEQALPLHLKKIAITRLYFDENQNLVGFFTVHNDLVKINPSDRHQSWNLPNEQHHFPAVKLHYLAIDRRYRNLGYGKHLLREAIFIADDISKESGCNFISIEALLSAVGFYIRRGFWSLERKPGLANMVFKLGEIEEEGRSLEVSELTRIRAKAFLAAERERMGISHAELADRLGIDEYEIEMFEYSSEAPRWETIELVAEGLGIGIEKLWKV